jgi:hypothetical protein
VQAMFVTSLHTILRVAARDTRLLWTNEDYDFARYPRCAVPFEEFEDEPVIIDPFDPTNNVAGSLQISDWRPLTYFATQTLDHLGFPDRIPLPDESLLLTSSKNAHSFRLSVHVLRAQQCRHAGDIEGALNAYSKAGELDQSNIVVAHGYWSCIKALSDNHDVSARESESSSDDSNAPKVRHLSRY